MRRAGWRTALVAAGVSVLVWGRGGGVPTADQPHAHMEDESRCAGCHHVEKEDDDWVLDPHIFRISVNDVCRTCHPKERMGRSHPVGSDPFRTLRLRRMPPDLPLQQVDGQRDELMTCGTCHNPHLPRFSTAKLFSRQPVFPGRSGEYLTYYLRVRGKDPREGFSALCNSCHPK